MAADARCLQDTLEFQCVLCEVATVWHKVWNSGQCLARTKDEDVIIDTDISVPKYFDLSRVDWSEQWCTHMWMMQQLTGVYGAAMSTWDMIVDHGDGMVHPLYQIDVGSVRQRAYRVVERQTAWKCGTDVNVSVKLWHPIDMIADLLTHGVIGKADLGKALDVNGVWQAFGIIRDNGWHGPVLYRLLWILHRLWLPTHMMKFAERLGPYRVKRSTRGNKHAPVMLPKGWTPFKKDGILDGRKDRSRSRRVNDNQSSASHHKRKLWVGHGSHEWWHD